jgi:hypothetical protein
MPKASAVPLCLVIVGAIALATTSASAASAGAAPLQSCKLGQAIYEPAAEERDEFGVSELEFFRDFMAERTLGKSGALRYKVSTGYVDYDVFTAWAPRGLFRPYFFIAETANPTDVIQDRAVTSVILPFGADFRPPRGNKTAPPYLIIPNLARDFYYWHEEQRKHSEKIIPPVTWKLVQCRGAS